ncbi:unnamed protein product [Closterium sp. NIES-64]|nr:unnamed protein product [Closterium sp. NIES-64]CAI6006812.1 unnamed protein product [Closterium sp. NIES-64]
MRGPQRAPRTVIDRALVILVALMWIAVALTWQAARWNIQKAQKEASNPDQRAQAQKGDWWEESMAGKQKAKEVAAAKAAAAKEAGYDSQITIGRSGREYGGVNSGEGGSRYAARATVGGDLGDRLSLGGDELEDYARQDVAVVDNTKRRRMKASTGDGHSDRSRIWHPVTEDDDIQDVPIDVRSIKRIRRRTDMDGELDWPIEVPVGRRALAASEADGTTGLEESRQGASLLGEFEQESRGGGRRITRDFQRRVDGGGEGEKGVTREAVTEREGGRMVDRVEYLREVILGFDTSGIKGLEEVREEVKGRHLVFSFEEEVSSDDVAPASVISR